MQKLKSCEDVVLRQGKKSGRLLAVNVTVFVFALACVTLASGQMTIGNRLNMTMDGSLGASYEGNFGKYSSSSHGQGFGINGILNGYYFDPKFLSFQVRPYYDRMQSNSESQTITRGSGVESSISLFGGSHFPGSISYGKNFSSNSEFRIAGIPSVLGNSSGNTFDIAWSALFKGLPSFSFNYLIANSTSTLLGTTSQSKSSSKSFGLNSDYKLSGFNLHGTFNHYNTEFLSPSFLTAAAISNTSSSNHYGVTATHKLPFSGNLGLMWSRTASENGASDSTSNSYTASAVLSPWRKLVVSETWNYTTNVLGMLAHDLNADASSFQKSGSGWNSMYTNTMGTLMVGHGLTVSGHLNYRTQHFQGRNLGDTQYGGSVNFRKTNRFLGFLHFSVGVVDTATQEGNGGLGLVANLGMTRKFGYWDTAADFSYSQNTQTLLVIATTSNYNFGGMIRRKINSSTYWSASFRESRSGLNAQSGNNNASESFATSFSWRKYSFSGNYSRSNGEALIMANNTLTSNPLGSIISNYFLIFNARSFGINASARLLRSLIVYGGYTNVSSNTIQKSLSAFNTGDRFNARIELRLRRLNIFGGFDRAVQESSAVPGAPRAVNSYYVSLSRWFKVF
jgi:hypothetical protein